jgi:hypothetical protein
LSFLVSSVAAWMCSYPLPHIDEAMPPSLGQYAGEHTKAWAAKIGSYDGFIFVTPPQHDEAAVVLFDQLESWSAAMKTVRRVTSPVLVTS